MKKYEKEMLETLKKFISFNSITDYSDATEDSPFGKTNRACLDYIISIAESLGFRTSINKGYYGYAEIGSGEELILILGHLDIVPVGDTSKWNTDALTLTIKDGIMYGRGVSDDKGPLVASLYAVKSLIDEAVIFNKRVRILFGCNEETGFKCVEKYVENEELPTYGFTPDSEFPLCHGEKGIMRLEFTAPLCKGVQDFKGGLATNAVADTASITFGSTKDKFLESLNNLNDDSITYVLDNRLTISAKGKSAHAANPNLGDNAIVKLMKLLGDLGVCAAAINDFNKLFYANDGSGLGIKMNDEFGHLTMNVGTVELIENVLTINVDIRYPITKTSSEVIDKINITDTTYEFKVLEVKEGIYFSLESDLVRTIMESYQNVTNDFDSKAYTMGGGTYARSMPNIVAIGGTFPNVSSKAHEANESAILEDFYKQALVHKEIVKNLLKL